ncbi:hypothetical protein ACOMHN_035086 [Nucella lapillus]
MLIPDSGDVWWPPHRDGGTEDTGGLAARVQALVQAEIATAGTADSFLRASHVLRTRRAHQVTAAALYILQHCAYKHYCLGESRDAEDLPKFEDWCCQRGEDIPQFHYWATVLELELLVQVYVRSLRQGSLMMYLDALTELIHWFHALDHTHYARWIPVHLKDMTELTTKHPDEMGNPFEEESQDVVKLDTKEIAGPAAVETVMNANRIGQEQFEAFTRECLLDRTKAVDDPIPRNKLKVFSTSTPRSQSKGQQQLASVKNDRELFARMYIGCHEGWKP